RVKKPRAVLPEEHGGGRGGTAAVDDWPQVDRAPSERACARCPAVEGPVGTPGLSQSHSPPVSLGKVRGPDGWARGRRKSQPRRPWGGGPLRSTRGPVRRLGGRHAPLSGQRRCKSQGLP